MHPALVALMVVLAAGPALGGGLAAAPADGTVTTGALSDDPVECEFPVEVEDATGETVIVEEEPEDVVVLAPSAAQHMWEIGAEDKVVGMPVNPFTAYLEGSEDRVNVVNQDGEVDQEQVVGLEPDLVLAPNVIPEETVESLRDADQTVYRSPLANSVDDVYGEVETVGLLTGEFESAAQVTAEMQGQVDAIEAAVAEEENPRVFYVLFGDTWTAGSNTLENDIITRAGGENIATASDEFEYFQISQEIIEEQDPEWLIIQEGAEVPDIAPVQESTAVANDQIIEVDPNLISQHGPRNVVPMTAMAEAFHPDAMADVDLDAVETPDPRQCLAAVEDETDDEAADEMADETDDDETDDAPADDDGPGFTAAAVAVALAVVALLARRQ